MTATLTTLQDLIQAPTSGSSSDAESSQHPSSKDGHAKTLQPASNAESRGLTALLAAERITGWSDPTYISDDMLRGIEDEPKARDIYSEHFAPVTETGLMIRDDNGVKLGYSPDGLVGDDGLIEIKSPDRR